MPSGAVAQYNPLRAMLKPDGSPAPAATTATAATATAEAPAAQSVEAALALRQSTIDAALRADTTIDDQPRAALADALGRVAVTVRALTSAAAEIESTRTRAQTEALGAPLAVDAAFARWLAQLPDEANVAELWLMLARLGTDVRALRRQERELLAGALAGALTGTFSDRSLWAPVPLESLTSALPDVPGHTKAVLEFARAVEDRRLAIVAAIDALRSSPVERVDRLRDARAALASRIALVQRQIDHVATALAAGVQASVQRIEAIVVDALARFPADSEAAAHARALRDLAAEVAHLHQRSALFEQRAILHSDQLDEIVRLADDTRERLAVQGSTQAIGLVLVNDLARTLPPERLAEELAALRGSLADLQIRVIDLRAQVLASGDQLAALSARELVARAAGETLDAQLLATMRTRLLVLVEAATQSVVAAMRGEEATLTELQRRNGDLRALISGRLLWTRSHARIDGRWLQQVLARIGSGRTLGTPLRDGARAAFRTLGSARGAVIAALLFVAWSLLARWQGRRLARIAAAPPPELLPAAAAVSRALLLAAPFAALALLALRGARGPAAPGSFDDSVLSGVGWSAWTALLLIAIAVSARSGGVGAVVLGWTESTRRVLRNTSVALLLLVLPSQVAVSAAWYRSELSALQYEARAVFIACWIGIAFVLWHALRAQGAWPEWRGLLRRVLRIGLAFAAGSAAVASALGYQITALAIARQLEGTLGVLGTLILAHGLILVAIAQAARRAEQRREVQAQLARMEGVANAESVPPPAAPEHEGEEHQRRLLRLALTVAGAFWLALLWTGLLPALRQLDDLVLWHVTTADARAAVSVLDVLTAIGIAVLMVVTLRLVPGLLDALLRERTRVEPGTRYAIGAVVRYAITIVGVIAAFGLIGVRWTHLQWMAAALTVGLGFGLQEIFGNFVSGLILLFERQVRVGDIVTVGDVTGRVTRISTRATTVLDFDRREIMIPNKSLITDRLVNWSLTSGLTRTTVKVGVAYGTDPALVHALLRRIADATPKVLARPAPLTVFTGFGPSNMLFDLRAYVASFDDREEVSNELYARIASEFAAAGVQIAYDQLEVRVTPAASEDREPSRGESAS